MMDNVLIGVMWFTQLIGLQEPTPQKIDTCYQIESEYCKQQKEDNKDDETRN